MELASPTKLSDEKQTISNFSHTESLVRCSNVIIISDAEDNESTMSENESNNLETRSMVSGCTSVGNAFKNINLDVERNLITFPNIVKIGIIPHESYPQPMRYSHIKQIQEALLDCAEEQLQTGTRVQFLGCTSRLGYLIMICASQETANWLKANIENIAGKSGILLKAVDEADFPKPVIMYGYFEQSADYTNDKILKRIEVSNKNLVTSGWNVLKRTQNGQTIYLLISIDDNSAEHIKKENGYIFYRFGQIKLKFEKSQKNQNFQKAKRNMPKTLTVAQSKQSITYNRSINVTSQNVCDWLLSTENYNTPNMRKKTTTRITKLPYKMFINPWQHQGNFN